MEGKAQVEGVQYKKKEHEWAMTQDTEGKEKMQERRTETYHKAKNSNDGTRKKWGTEEEERARLGKFIVVVNIVVPKREVRTLVTRPAEDL